MSRSRGWCFTVNNYAFPEEEAVKSLSDEAEYVVCGKEVGESGTPHLQGYAYFKNQRTFASVKKKLRSAHLEPAKGSPEQNREYCTKQGVWYESGSIPRQGKRTDIDVVRDLIQENLERPMSKVVAVATSYQSVKMAEVYLKYHEPPRCWKPEVIWWHGPTGTGKSKAAMEWLGDDVYVAMSTIKWFEGYDGHANVLLDDIRGDFAKFHELLRLLDRYPMKIETKGGSRQFLARKIAITSCYSPEELYRNKTSEDISQLVRRIDEVRLLE